MDLFDELRAGGRLDSQGKFTLAGEKALDKLRRFQLKDPSHYLLFALRAAVAGGASRVWIQHSTPRIRIGAPGWRPPVNRDLLSGLFESPDEDPVAYYLGVVANHVPVEVDRDGITITHSVGPLRWLRSVQERGVLSSLQTASPMTWGTSDLRGPRVWFEEEGDDDPIVSFEGAVCRGELRVGREGPIAFYKHGLPLRTPQVVLAGPPVTAWFAADRLRLDVSGQTAIEDERWEEVRQDLQAVPGQLLATLVRPQWVRTPRFRNLLLRTLISQAGAALPVSRDPVRLLPPPREFLEPSTPSMKLLVEAPLIQLEDEPYASVRELAIQVTRKHPVLVNVTPAEWTGASSASFVSPGSASLLQCWPAEKLPVR